MNRKFIRMLSGAKIGDIELEKDAEVEVDEKTAKELIDKKLAVDITEEKSQAALDAKIEKLAEAKVTEKLEAAKTKAAKDAENKAGDGHIETKANPLDPAGGYIGAKSIKDYTKNEKDHANGLFLVDIMKAGTTGETASPKLDKWLKMHEDFVKAAGTGMQVGGDAEGGFAAFPIFSMELLDRTTNMENVVVRPRANVITGDAQQINLPVWKDVSHSSDLLFGGISVAWEAEDATISESRPKLEKLQLTKKKMTALVYISFEMRRWTPITLGGTIAPQLAQAIAWKEDDGFINGDGAGLPLGLLNCNCVVSIDKETNQTAATIVYKNVLKMLARILIKQESAVVWIANRTIIPQLAQMNLTTGTGGSPVYIPASVIAGQPWNMLFGYPILFTEKAAALGTVGDIILTDLSQYVIFDDVQGLDVAQSTHIKFLEAQEAIRVIRPTDGQSMLRSAFTPKNGDSLSPIITLATRS
jgi:HK97 family phage major capsid protein